MFAVGVVKLGKGNWEGIARDFLVSRTPAEVARLAQEITVRYYPCCLSFELSNIGQGTQDEDALEQKEDGNQAENTSHDLENLETPIYEALHVEAAESLGDIIIDGQKRDLDETPETSEAEDKSKGFDQHDDSFSHENVESPEVISNIDQAGTQDERPGSKDGNNDSISSGRDVTNLSSNDKEDILQLPSERDNENSPDQNERANVGDNSVSQSELITLEEEKNDNGEAITSEEERALRDNDQSEGGEKGSENGSQVEKDTIDSHGEDKLETEDNSESGSEVEKTEASKSHGGLESDPEGNSLNNLEGTTVEESSDDASLFLPREENGESNESESLQNNIHDSQDASIDVGNAPNFLDLFSNITI